MMELRNNLDIADIKALEEVKAAIRRESRKRCLDEIEALSKDEPIEAGVGSDVIAVYSMALLRYENKKVKNETA